MQRSKKKAIENGFASYDSGAYVLKLFNFEEISFIQ